MTKHETILEVMRRFDIPFMNAAGELIIDVKENVYCSTEGIETPEEIEASIVMSVTRPIYKGLSERKALALLDRINRRYDTLLTRDDMGDMYKHLCLWRLLPNFQRFIADGFPMDKIEEYAKEEKA